MSHTAARASKRIRRACQHCRERKARYRYRGHVKADRYHPLCFECFRAERERRRARLLAQVTRPADPAGWAPRPVRGTELVPRNLRPEQIEHRRRMLDHLSRR